MSSVRPFDVVAIGETLASLTGARVGRLETGDAWRMGVGGAESNVLAGLQRLGLSTCWLGRVGDDELGELVLARLRSEGIDVNHAVVDPTAPTGLMLKWRRAAGHTRVAYRRAGSAATKLSPSDLPAGLVESAKVLHVTGITVALGDGPAALIDLAVDRALAAGTLVSLDINHRGALWRGRDPRPLLVPLARRAHVVMGSPAELAILHPDLQEAASLAERVGGSGAVWAVAKLGAEGAVAYHRGVRLRATARSVAVVDLVGAGDAFAAGLLWALLDGQAPADCLATAVALGTFACTVEGDFEGLPSAAELAELDPEADPVIR